MPWRCALLWPLPVDWAMGREMKWQTRHQSKPQAPYSRHLASNASLLASRTKKLLRKWCEG